MYCKAPATLAIKSSFRITVIRKSSSSLFCNRLTDESYRWQAIYAGRLICSSRSCLANIGMHEIIAFVEQWFALVAGQRVSEAVAEVQIRPVPAAFPVVAIGLPSDPGML